jgi:hypothetical protein
VYPSKDEPSHKLVQISAFLADRLHEKPGGVLKPGGQFVVNMLNINSLASDCESVNCHTVFVRQLEVKKNTDCAKVSGKKISDNTNFLFQNFCTTIFNK